MIDIEVKNALQALQNGELILYPTDTVWGIGCDATNHKAIEKIYALKQREESKSLICLVSDMEMLQNHLENIPEVAIDLLKYVEKPTTIIYDNPIRIAENLIAEDNTLAIRLVNNDFCNTLIKALGKPLVSTSANISGKPTPNSFQEISEDILKGVDYVVNLPDEKTGIKPSSIIKLSNDGQVKVIRE